MVNKSTPKKTITRTLIKEMLANAYENGVQDHQDGLILSGKNAANEVYEKFMKKL